MVFDPTSAPGTSRAAVIAWLEDEAEWGDGPYDDPARGTPAVQAWLEELLREFPAVDGPRAHAGHHPRLTDYTIGRAVVYACFPWTAVEAAYEAVVSAAATHGLGVYDVSSDDLALWLPDGKGELALLEKATTKKKKAAKKRATRKKAGKTKATKKKGPAKSPGPKSKKKTRR